VIRLGGRSILRTWNVKNWRILWDERKTGVLLSPNRSYGNITWNNNSFLFSRDDVLKGKHKLCPTPQLSGSGCPKILPYIRYEFSSRESKTALQVLSIFWIELKSVTDNGTLNSLTSRQLCDRRRYGQPTEWHSGSEPVTNSISDIIGGIVVPKIGCTSIVLWEYQKHNVTNTKDNSQLWTGKEKIDNLNCSSNTAVDRVFQLYLERAGNSILWEFRDTDTWSDFSTQWSQVGIEVVIDGRRGFQFSHIVHKRRWLIEAKLTYPQILELCIYLYYWNVDIEYFWLLVSVISYTSIVSIFRTRFVPVRISPSIVVPTDIKNQVQTLSTMHLHTPESPAEAYGGRQSPHPLLSEHRDRDTAMKTEDAVLGQMVTAIM